MDKWFDYDEVFLLPSYSTVVSRKIPDTVCKLYNWELNVPVISANMDSITEEAMAVAMWNNGGIGALHRFADDARLVRMYERVREHGDCIVSVGVGEKALVSATFLYRAGATVFMIDVAHGHHILVKETIKRLRENLKDIYIIAGNVGTPEGVKDLDKWGADAIKVGHSNGRVCTTKYVTGIETPMFTAIQLCRKATNKPIIADGGIRSPGDVCKALAAGADLVMVGYLLAGTAETPAATKGTYRGNSSAEVQGLIGSDAVPEGTSIGVELKGNVVDTLTYIRDSLKSSMSYTGAINLKEFRSKATFGVKK